MGAVAVTAPVQWWPPGDPRHSPLRPVVPIRLGHRPGDVVEANGRGVFWLRVNCGAMTWKKLAAGDWIVVGEGGQVEWWSDRRMQGTEWSE